MHFVFAFDGVDGSGKSMITEMVKEDLYLKYKSRGFQIVKYAMPGATAMGSAVRNVIKNPKIQISPLAERFLFAADTADFFHTLLCHMRDNPLCIYIVDRWSPVTDYMYGIPRGIDEKLLSAIRRIYMSKELVVYPDMLFLVDVQVEDMLRRINLELRPKCRIELLGEHFHRHVWSMYHDAINDPKSKQRKHCEAMTHSVVPLNNTDPSSRSVRDVAYNALELICASIEDRIANLGK